jgi:hypothetical protein
MVDIRTLETQMKTFQRDCQQLGMVRTVIE